MISRPVSALIISPSLRDMLLNAGFENCAEILQLGAVGLSRELQISTKDAAEIVQAASCEKVSLQGISALDMLESEESQQFLKTGCNAIDQLFGGAKHTGRGSGLPCGQITEVCGAPGTGKSQMAMQCSVQVLLPNDQGGLDGEALYIDTEGSLFPDRVSDLIKARLSGDTDPAQELAGIHYYRVHDHVEQIAIVQLLPEILRQYPRIKLIVMDSVAFHFRHSFKDVSLRTRLLTSLGLQLAKIAKSFDLVVLVVNQMTVKLAKESAQGASSAEALPNKYLLPALGGSWAHAANHKVLFETVNGRRRASIIKSSSFSNSSAYFSIQQSGLCDSVQ